MSTSKCARQIEGFLETVPDHLLRIEDVARILSISARQVWRCVAAGEIPRPVRASGCTRWRQTQIDQYIASLTPTLRPMSSDQLGSGSSAITNKGARP